MYNTQFMVLITFLKHDLILVQELSIPPAAFSDLFFQDFTCHIS